MPRYETGHCIFCRAHSVPPSCARAGGPPPRGGFGRLRRRPFGTALDEAAAVTSRENLSAGTEIGAIDGPSFEIWLVWSERTLVVASGQTALEVLVGAGFPIEPGCQTGGCGMCATEYVEGDVIHKDGCLNAAERAHLFCPCVSRAATRVVIAA